MIGGTRLTGMISRFALGQVVFSLRNLLSNLGRSALEALKTTAARWEQIKPGMP